MCVCVRVTSHLYVLKCKDCEQLLSYACLVRMARAGGGARAHVCDSLQLRTCMSSNAYVVNNPSLMLR